MSLIPVKVLAEIRLTSKPAALVVKALNSLFPLWIYFIWI